VNKLDELDTILYDLIATTGCGESDPTKAPTVGPTDAPTCKEQDLADMCIAIDNSGSICSEGTPRLCEDCNSNTCRANGNSLTSGHCCRNYDTLTEFATKYINGLPSSEFTTFSIVKFATSASLIGSTAVSAETAIAEIENSPYTGGWTNTQDAIDKCRKALKGKKNPMMVLLTDGTPTACKTDEGKTKHAGQSRNGCSRESCPACRGEADTHQEAAELAADLAAREGISLVPVIISSVEESKEQLEKLARCPANSDPNSCDVGDYKNLSVNKLEELDQVLGKLIATTGCGA